MVDAGMIIFFSLFIGFIMFIVFLTRLGFKREAERTEDIKNFAISRGLDFYEKEDGNFVNVKKDFSLFMYGRRQTVKNIIIKDKLLIFDYSYYISTGKGGSVKYFTVVEKKLTNDVPNFIIKKQKKIHSLLKKVGYQDIDFKENPNFSSKYVLRGQNESMIKSYFNTQRLKDFENLHIKNKIEIKDNVLICYVKRIQLKNYPEFIEEINKIINALEK
ncbi:MAG: hypothetical protein ACOC16_02205 [Nanoarchaeota archaeon]